MHHPYTIGLTGGIACGKTAACRVFTQLQIPIIDADVISRQLTALGSPLLPKIAKELGPDCLNADGTLCRPYVRKLVFADEHALAKLNAILHPAIHHELLARAHEVGAQAPYVVMAIPLLFEHKLDALMDRILVLDCSEQLQLQRIIARDGSSEATARSIIAHQVSRAYRIAHADDLVSTQSSDLQALALQIKKLHSQYCAYAAAACRARSSEA